MKPLSSRTICLLALSAVLLLTSGLTFAARDNGDGWLGVHMQDLKPSLVRALQLESDQGVLVDEVVADSPADEAGLEDGDIIIEFDGSPVENGSALAKAVKRTDPGDRVEVMFVRAGDERRLTVEIGDRGDAQTEKLENVFIKKLGKSSPKGLSWVDEDDEVQVIIAGMSADHGYLGVMLDDLEGQLGDYFGVKDGEGALVTTVVEDTPAEDCGLKAGDVIVAFAGEDIESALDLHNAAADTEPDDEVTLTVIRDQRERTFTATLAEVPEDMQLSKVNCNVADICIQGPHGLQTFTIDIDDDDLHHHEQVLQHFESKRAPMIKRMIKRDIEDDELEELREEMQDELKALKKELKELRKELGDG